MADPEKLKRNIHEITAGFIASGLDPKKSIIFNQSSVQEHAELSWLLNCVARVGWLNRMTQFKEKAGKIRKNVCWSVHLPDINGGRYTCLQSHPCPCRGGSKAAY